LYDDPPRLHDISAMGQHQSLPRVLFDKHNCYTPLVYQLQLIKNFLYKNGGQP